MQPSISPSELSSLAALLNPLRPGLLATQSDTPVGEPAPAPPADASGLFDEVFFLKLGFSFMVGLAIGFALKIAFKIALVVGGLILLALFALQYTGVVDISWSGVEVRYDSWISWLSARAGAFFDFIGDNLTSTASFLAGLAIGLKL
jgi:uncharacterized membrane protein (Fun14 family)